MAANRKCAHYPCHTGLEDCTFCYCPLYPCQDEARGKYIISKKSGRQVWSCRDCNWIHKKKVVDNIFHSIKNEQSVGVIILAHGSKLKSARETTQRLSELVKRALKLKDIMPAYLQLCQPTLADVIGQLVKKGCRKIVIVPYFLFNGIHVTRDIPSLIKKARERFPGIDLIYTKSLSEEEQTISSIISQRIKEVI